MSEIFPYELRYWYPHMMPADVKLWERFIAKFPNAYDSVEYDVKVGSAPEFDTIVSPETKGDDINLYRRKIDVVGFRGASIDIIELKPRAGTGAIGQIVGYAKLYTREFNPPEPVNRLIITDQLLPDMEFLASSAGVRLVVV